MQNTVSNAKQHKQQQIDKGVIVVKKVLSAILVLIMLSATLVACDTQDNKEIAPEDLPPSIDLRNYDGKNYVTPPQRQVFGDCWAFGTAGASEISYIYANDLGVPAGEVNDNVNFSEKYMAWYVYHSITQDDVKLGKVRASQVGEGYDVREAESEYIDAPYFFGGAIYAGSNLFASGFNPVDEKTSVNSEYPYAYSGKYSEIYEGEVQYSPDDDWSLPLNAEYRNVDSVATFSQSHILPCPATYDENGEYVYNEAGVTAIKTELVNGRGVAFAALVDGRMNYENWATYNLTNDANHVITVVGYDDNYPKENFAQVDNASGETQADSIPPTDGAFLIKNSSGEWGLDQSGYFYISYHDRSISHPTSYSFEKNDSVICKNPNYDQYDLLMIGWFANNDYDAQTKTANVFDAQMDESLFQIAYKTPLADTSVHYEIYKNIEDDNPESGKLLEKGDATHKWAGYYKTDLKNKYKLKKGEKYSIVLTMTYEDGNKASRYTDIISYANSRQDGAIANGVINKGESYLFTNGKWNDLVDVKDTLAKTAYEHNKQENMFESFKAQNLSDIAVDNFPIKGILIPEN